MTMVRSGWARSSPFISGSFSPGEWDNAGKLPIPAGYLLVKNDSKFLYLAMDLIGDTGNSIGVGDYFWLDFDVDGNRSITPRVDVMYSIYPTLPIRIARSYCLAPSEWTTILPGHSDSLARQGFGTSPNSATPHRIWELRIDLAEINRSLGGTTPPFIGFGLRVASSSPAFVYNYPSNFYANFSDLPQIALSLGPDTDPPGSGSVIATVGNIPTGSNIIAGGRATTASTYDPFVQNAAFGGTMYLKGNQVTMQKLWDKGARKYRVWHHDSNTTFEHIRQYWSNYRWVGPDCVLESFGPDAEDKYVMLDPSQEYSVHNLLLRWESNGFLPGIHEFEVEFFSDSGGSVGEMRKEQTLRLFLDNNLPDLNIIEVSYKDNIIKPCDFVMVDDSTKPVKVHIRAFDAEGDLRKYVLDAHYGKDQVFSPSLADVPYPGSGLWLGDADRWISAPLPPQFPPIRCAYQLRLWAWTRVTNGQWYIHYNEATYHITFDVPTAPTMAPISAEPLLGFSGPDNRFEKGTTPKKLGG